MKQIIAVLIVLLLAGCATPQQVIPATSLAPAVEITPAQEPAPHESQEPVVKASEQAPLSEPEPEPLPGPVTAKDTVILKQGSFHNVVHPTDGIVKIYQQPNGDKTMNFIGFDTVPGPGLTIMLHSGSVKDGFVVSTLTSASGNYPYDLPKDLDVSKYTSVAIYNKKYNVIYGEADLH